MFDSYLIKGKVKLKEKPSLYEGNYFWRDERTGDQVLTNTEKMARKFEDDWFGIEMKRVGKEEANQYCRKVEGSYSWYYGGLDSDSISQDIKGKCEKNLGDYYELLGGELEIWKVKCFPSRHLSFYETGERIGSIDAFTGEIKLHDNGHSWGKRKLWGIRSKHFSITQENETRYDWQL